LDKNFDEDEEEDRIDSNEMVVEGDQEDPNQRAMIIQGEGE
jgi:hypothetical protein